MPRAQTDIADNGEDAKARSIDITGYAEELGRGDAYAWFEANHHNGLRRGGLYTRHYAAVRRVSVTPDAVGGDGAYTAVFYGCGNASSRFGWRDRHCFCFNRLRDVAGSSSAENWTSWKPVSENHRSPTYLTACSTDR
jgi:hypothetical protein